MWHALQDGQLARERRLGWHQARRRSRSGAPPDRQGSTVNPGTILAETSPLLGIAAPLKTRAGLADGRISLQRHGNLSRWSPQAGFPQPHEHP